MDKYLCVHGHFYQPPRENPWIEEIEVQEGAAPYHDWNEKILKECYEPNSCARIVDGQNRIIDIVNNYSLISFNFGPTLLSWMEKKSPHVYERILEADRESLERTGHGNAIAQAYNHTILPLASATDRETQIIWGIEDFRHRFMRQPEAMWLPETAVNTPVIEALIKHGIKFIILSPAQAQKVRSLKGGNWKDVSNGSIDTTRPYRSFIKDKKGNRLSEQYIDIFFYNGMLSGEISFGDLLNDGDKFADKLDQAYSKDKRRPQLINVACDGETFGHHKKFGEMALAFALRKANEVYKVKIINYSTYLNKYPSEHEVELSKGPDHEGTAWSCAHGVRRWREDCGCKVEWKSSYNQKWRKPLREALNFLRSKLAEIFEREGKRFFHDCRKAKNEYITVMLDRSRANREKYFDHFCREGLDKNSRIQALSLLEMERQAQLMFTSCGWFFDDLSGIEPIQILKYAHRAMYFAGLFIREDIEEKFLTILETAESNVKGYGNGRKIYHNFVKPAQVSMEKILNHAALMASLKKNGENERERSINLYHYTIEFSEYDKIEQGKMYLCLGQATITSGLTEYLQQYFFVLAFLGGSLFRTAIRKVADGVSYVSVKESLIKSFTENPQNIFMAMNDLLGDHYYSLRDMFHEEKQRILSQLITNELESYEDSIAKFYDDSRETMEAVLKEGMIIPDYFKVAAGQTLTKRLTCEISMLADRLEEVLQRGIAKAIMTRVCEFGYSLHLEKAEVLLSDVITNKIKKLEQNLNGDTIDLASKLMGFVLGLNIPFDLMEAQNIFHRILQEKLPAVTEDARTGDEKAKGTADALLNLAQKMNFNTERYLKMMT